MADSVPRLVVLGRPTSGGATTYLQYVVAPPGAKKGKDYRRLQLSSPVVMSETNFTRLEVVRAPDDVGQDMVHIRSAYNNKYLVLESEGSNFFVVGANDFEEDRSKWSCTLFRATFVDNQLSLMHQSSGAEHSVQVTSSFLSIVRNSTESYWFQVTNMSSLAILPKYVAFKGDNNMYLSSQYRRLHNRLYFGSRDINDQTVHHETITLNNGNIRLKSMHFGKLWRKSKPEWIMCDTNDTNTYDHATTYRPIRLSNENNTIALLNLANNKYCMRWVRGGQPRLIDTLTASASRVMSLATLTVEEAVRERLITNIRYHIEDARTYNSTAQLEDDNSCLVQHVTNHSHEAVVQTLGFTYGSSTEKKFCASHSWKLSYNTKMEVTIIPDIVEGEIHLDATYEGKMECSEISKTSLSRESKIAVPVPPLSKVTVTLLIGQGLIDVPFSYTQYDTLPDGTSVTHNLHDGLFTGRTTVITYDVGEATKLTPSELEMAARDLLDHPEDDHPLE